MFRRTKRVGCEIVAAETDAENAALRDGVTEKDGRDADHSFDDPAENEAVHERAEIDGAEAAEEGGGFALIAELDEFDVGKNFGAAPVAREEKDGHHAAEALRPPEPVAGDAVARDESGDEQRSVGGESGGDHGGAREPPGNVAAGDEKFFGTAGGPAPVVKRDEEIEEQVGGDYDPISGGKDHYSFCSAGAIAGGA